MSQLKVNSIIPVAGVPTGGGGGIIQVVEGTTSSEVSTTGVTYVDTNLTANITPTSASSKILVLVDHQLLMDGNGGGNGCGVRLLRGSTVIADVGPEDGNGPFPFYAFTNAASNIVFSWKHSLQKLDSPNTTSQVTYKTQMRLYQSINSFVLYAQRNRSSENGESRILLMEVSA